MLLKKLLQRVKRLFQKRRRRKSLKYRAKKGGSRPKFQLEKTPQIEAQKSALQITPKKGIHAATEFSLVQLSEHTQRAYKKDMDDFLSYLNVEGKLQYWGSLSAAEIAEYRTYLKEVRGLAPSSITRKLAVVKSFYKWAQAQMWVDRSPAELIRGYPQSQDSKTGFLGEEEILKLLHELPLIKLANLSRALVRVGVETLLMLGLRRSEAVAIRAGDLEFSDGRWLVLIKGKGNRDRRLPLPGKLLESWSFWWQRINNEAPIETMAQNPDAWLDWARRHFDQCLLISTRAVHYNKQLSTSELGRIVRKAGLKAGLSRRLSPHMLRSSAITYALDKGASHRGVQQMAGWTSPLMITRYDKRRNDPRFSAIHKLNYANQDKDQADAADKKLSAESVDKTSS